MNSFEANQGVSEDTEPQIPLECLGCPVLNQDLGFLRLMKQAAALADTFTQDPQMAAELSRTTREFFEAKRTVIEASYLACPGVRVSWLSRVISVWRGEPLYKECGSTYEQKMD